MPAFGILEDRNLPHVPGTVILDDQVSHSDGNIHAGLKHGTGRNAHIVLVPQPSAHANDPLNWPQAKKLTALGVTCWGSVLYVGVVAGLLNASLATVAAQIDSTIAALVLTQGYQFLVVGVSGPIYSALSRKFGTRPIFVFASIIILIGSIIGSVVQSYNGILISRIIQGIGMAPYESVIFTLISDLFFVHERGIYASLIQFTLLGISNITGVVAGPIVDTLSWPFL
jgi:MFS family permease